MLVEKLFDERDTAAQIPLLYRGDPKMRGDGIGFGHRQDSQAGRCQRPAQILGEDPDPVTAGARPNFNVD
jgi:hypothetical protein